jgi:group I intron endonuclease
MIGFIYKTTNMINGRSYIGMCSSPKRFNTYLGSGTVLKQAIEKYGHENFKREILEECDTEEQLRVSEAKWIEHYDAVNSDEFYNLSEGGRGGKTANYRKMGSIVKKTWNSYTPEEKKARLSTFWYDKSGSKNPTAVPVRIVDGKGTHTLDYLKAYLEIRPDMPYSTLKGLYTNFKKPGYKLRSDSKYVDIKSIENLNVAS